MKKGKRNHLRKGPWKIEIKVIRKEFASYETQLNDLYDNTLGEEQIEEIRKHTR